MPKENTKHKNTSIKSLSKDIETVYREREYRILNRYSDKFKDIMQKWIDTHDVDLFYGFEHEYPKGSEFQQPDFEEWNSKLLGLPYADRRFYKNGKRVTKEDTKAIISIKVQRAARGSSNANVFRASRRQNKGIVFQYEVFKKNDKTDNYIVLKTYEKDNPVPLFDKGNTQAGSTIGDWIVEGVIHPLPPYGGWWDKKDWLDLSYPAIPLYDMIEESSEFQDLLDKLYEECNQVFKQVYEERVTKYIRNSIIYRRS